MRILSAQLALQAQHTSSRSEATFETLSLARGGTLDPARPPSGGGAPRPGGTGVAHGADAGDAASADPVLSLLKTIVELLTGRPVDVLRPEDLQALSGTASSAPEAAAAAPRAALPALDLRRITVSRESEQGSFSARGTVSTADGREIAVAVELAMARDHVETTETSVSVGGRPRRDPLVLNLDGAAARLSEARHAIDLNGDGTAEAVPLLAGASAYLAWDRNGNGRVDGGSELFGPATGDGMRELAARDADGNGWIDEADPAFASLSLWVPAAQEGGRLTGLAEAGIGAIGLASAATPFELRGNRNEDLGAVRRTGVYLTEAGRAGTVQEIDLTA